MLSTDQHDIPDTPVRKRSHNALEIVDIIDQVLLKLIEDKQAKKTDLVSMARCCKAFEDPSLNRLWASMSSVVPLLKLIHGVEEFQGSLIITGKIDFKKLPPRVQSYAKRIRDVNYDVTGDFSQVDSSTWMRLEHVNGALLPNLRSFRLSYTNPSTLGKERSLLLLPALLRSGSLSSFTFKTSPVTNQNTRYEVGPILNLLGDYNLEIETLEVAGTFISRYSKVLGTIRSLQCVSLEMALDSNLPDVLTALSSLPRIRRLTLAFFGTTLHPGHLQSHTFPELVGITLRGKITFMSRVLAAIKAPSLEYVDIKVMPGAGDGTQESVLPSLQLIRFPALKRIFIDLVGCNSSPRLGERDNKLSIVNPILGNSCVEELVMTSLDPSMCLSDYEVIDLATSWPLLKVLRLEHTSRPTERPTFASLGYLAERCPCLVELSVSLREERLHDVGLKPMSTLGELNLQHTDIKRYARAARYIDKLFPFLYKFSMSEQQTCEAVRDIIFEACKPVRKDEQSRKVEKIIINGWGQL
ncbi:hypothetical protein BDZ94DRAFT_1269115 [Collybia nuda]|uniref:F-box domain-containing protein n=1 Tax=Collybia nuda TaxID=64659 RepID=A0A9P6CB50_9AGAR|nr:hypothetical protein BDZ94DRAFT_1269115 [Collybia nuda]